MAKVSVLLSVFLFALFGFGCASEPGASTPLSTSAQDASDAAAEASTDPVYEVRDPDRYSAVKYKSIKATKAIAYGENDNFATNRRDKLTLDFYEPEDEDAVDLARTRGLFVLLHGGFFIGGSSELDSMVQSCRGFASYGYACASINYRKVSINEASADGLAEAAVQAIQDAKAAIRFFRAEQARYRIDVEHIFVGGYSAGAVAALHAGYVTEADLEETSPKIRGFFEKHGGLEGASGHPDQSSAVAGVFAISGGLLAKDFVDEKEVPLFLAHGDKDEVIPFTEGEVTGPLGMNLGRLDGSSSLETRAKEVGIETSLFVVKDGLHETPDEAAWRKKIRDSAAGFFQPFAVRHLVSAGT